jgi:hypothetical protein
VKITDITDVPDDDVQTDDVEEAQVDETQVEPQTNNIELDTHGDVFKLTSQPQKYVQHCYFTACSYIKACL